MTLFDGLLHQYGWFKAHSIYRGLTNNGPLYMEYEISLKIKVSNVTGVILTKDNLAKRTVTDV